MKKNQLLILLLLTLICIKSQGQLTVNVGTGTLPSAFSPIVKSYECIAYEGIYLSSEIIYAGNILTFGYNRVDGTDTLPFDSINIYMKLTNLSTLSNGNVDYNGYTLVYSGIFPNNSGSGWREVILDTNMFYDPTFNLGVLVVKNFQPASANTPVSPRWHYTTTTGTRARRYYGALAVNTQTSLTATTVLSNVRINLGTIGLLEITPDFYTVFPNPSSGTVNIKIHDKRNINFELTDLSGRKLVSKELSAFETIDVNKFSSGVYTLLFYDEDKKLLSTQKIVIDNQ